MIIPNNILPFPPPNPHHMWSFAFLLNISLYYTSPKQFKFTRNLIQLCYVYGDDGKDALQPMEQMQGAENYWWIESKDLMNFLLLVRFQQDFTLYEIPTLISCHFLD